MFTLKKAILILVIFLSPGCAAVPFGIGLIPGAPAYFSSLVGGSQSMYATAVDERTTEQQMMDAIIAGHAQAELYKSKEIGAGQISTYSYFGKLYLVGEYDSQEQLKYIYECADKVEGKRAIISCLYLRSETEENEYFHEKAKYAELQTQLMADFEVTSTPIDVEIIHGDMILLGVIKDQEERDRIMAHALSVDGIDRVVSYLYHQENAGPDPHIMVAGLTPSSMTQVAPPPKKKPKNTRSRPIVTKKKAPAAPVLAVTNPDRGR
nr:BON domain-containing protein [uncultured Pseudodesulfovibrio sp.]